jgi:urease accessory protein
MGHFRWHIWQLADSAFPTGGFAHSWGLEAAWHSGAIPDAAALRRFVHDVVCQTGGGALPFLTSAYRESDRFEDIDRANDIFLTNVVANRASRVQGRAFLSTCLRVWPSARLDELDLRARNSCGHCAPAVGAALAALGVDLEDAQRLFLFSTVRGVLAAAVRLGIIGSYHAQRVQYDAAPALEAIVQRCGSFEEPDAVQTAPIVDLLQATHDRLYSRLFQS